MTFRSPSNVILSSQGPASVVRSCWLLLVVVSLLLVAGPQSVDAASLSPRARIQADRELVGIMQIRDRGQIDGALERVAALIARYPDFVPAHRLYQEMAVLSGRTPVLVEAEYRHLAETQPEDPRANLLHAAATLSAISASPELLNREVLRDIERKIALAEGAPEFRSQALLLSADIARWGGDGARYESQIRAALKADKRSLTVRSDLSIYLASRKEWAEASDVCIGLVTDAPWRLISCTPLVPSKAGKAAPSQADQDRLIRQVERIEKRAKKDAVTAQSLERFFAAVGEKRGAKRVEGLLSGLDEAWVPPVARNPYASPLPGGELDAGSIDFIEMLQSLRKDHADDPGVRVKRLLELSAAVPEDPRMIAYYHRELAFTLRNPAVDDRAASRAAIRKAWEATPDDPSVMNELAYMSAVDGVDLEESLVLVDAALTRLLGEPFEPMDISFGDSFADFEIARAETVGAYLDTRGWVLFQLGRFDEAQRALVQAGLMTRDGTVQAHLGRTCHALGNTRGAFHHLIRGLALGTEDGEVVRTLAEALYAELHVIPGGLDVLVQALQEELLREGMEVLGGAAR